MVLKHLLHVFEEGFLSCFYICCGISAALRFIILLLRLLGRLLFDRLLLCRRLGSRFLGRLRFRFRLWWFWKNYFLRLFDGGAGTQNPPATGLRPAPPPFGKGGFFGAGWSVAAPKSPFRKGLSAAG